MAKKKIDPLNKKQYGAVSAMLTVSDIPAAVSFYQKAFGSTKRGIMNGPDGKAIHDPALGKAKSLLIKAHSSRYVGDGEHSRNGAVLLLVEWINFLLSHGAPFSKTNILANTPGMVHLCFRSGAAYQNRT